MRPVRGDPSTACRRSGGRRCARPSLPRSFSTPGPPPCTRMMSAYLARAISSRSMTAAGFAMSLPPVIATRVPCGRCAMVLRSLRAPLEVAGVDGGRGQLAGLRWCAIRAVAATWSRSRRGRRRRLRRAWSRRRRAELVRFCERSVTSSSSRDLISVPSCSRWRSRRSGQQPVGGAVETLGLGVEHVDEAPQQALAFVGELRAVRDRRPVRGCGRLSLTASMRVVGVPDVAGVELVALGRCAVERCLFAGCCCCGLFVRFDLCR